MAPSIASTWRTFWHAMTSNDRHASHDSPYRTGRHVPLPQSRHAPLTSVATSAMESRGDLNSPYAQEDPGMVNGFIGSPKSSTMSPNSPYAPGMRSSLGQQAPEDGEIQMRNFEDGLPPPPPVAHSWKRIDRWCEDNYPELFDNIGEGATQNDVNELEHELDATLPLDVRESLMTHDGQERGGLPTGIIFGCMILDCEEILEEWQNWRKVNEEFLTQGPAYVPQPPEQAFGASSSSTPPAPLKQAGTALWRQHLLNRQDSQPPNAVQKAYAHPGWIPLARDWGGNCLAVDLAPGPTGKWGQVVIFGRDYDCKYVVARSWAHFLATVADDLSTDKVWVDEDTNELRFRAFPQQNVEPPYLEILRWRCDQKYGRKGPKRRPGPNGGLHINSNVGPARNISPYASPVSGPEDRGRSPVRLGQRGAASSPRAHISSPLARVAEEGPAPIRVHTDPATAKSPTNGPKLEKLVSIDTPRNSPRPSQEGARSKISPEVDKDGEKKGKAALTGVEEMKTVQI